MSKVPNRPDFLGSDKGRNALFDRVDTLEGKADVLEGKADVFEAEVTALEGGIEDLGKMFRFVDDDSELLSVQAEVDVPYGEDQDFNIKADVGGTDSHEWDIIFVDPEDDDVSLDVAIDEGAKTVTVTHATDGSGEITTGAAALKTAFNAECTGVFTSDDGTDLVVDHVGTVNVAGGVKGIIARKGTQIYDIAETDIYVVIGDLIEKDGENVVAADFRKIDTEASGLT